MLKSIYPHIGFNTLMSPYLVGFFGDMKCLPIYFLSPI